MFVLRLLRMTAGAGILSALYGAAQYLGWDALLPGQAYRFGEGLWAIVRPPGTLGHAAYFATFLLLAAFAGAGLLLVRQKRSWRLFGGVAVALSVFEAC